MPKRLLALSLSLWMLALSSPTSTHTAELRGDTVSQKDPNCEWVYRIAGDKCADACLPAYVGPCPRSIPTFFGRLKRGQCMKHIYSVPDPKGLAIHAGPCGRILFSLNAKPKSSVVRPKHRLERSLSLAALLFLQTGHTPTCELRQQC